jgi:Tfp pilus assembly protein PilF
VIENYIGVAKAFMGAKQEASHHFRRALELKPDYDEPVDNLRNLGWRTQFSAVGIPRIF